MTTPTPVPPVVYQVSVNGTRITDFPLDMTLQQTWGEHDVATIRIEYNRAFPVGDIMVWPDNAAVSILWGQGPNPLQTWYGYVSHSEQKSNADSGTHDLQYTYYLIGTSKPMNTDNSFVWGNVSGTYIATQMATKYHFRSVLTSTDWVLSGETQANMSDFDYLNYIANKIGYRFWVSGGTLYFIDPAVVLAGTSSQSVPVFRQDKLLTQQDTMRNFRQLQGDNLPGSTVAQRQIYGIDPTSGHLFLATAGNSTGTGNATINGTTPISGTGMVTGGGTAAGPGTGTGATTGTIAKTNTARVPLSYANATQIVNAWQGLSQFWIGAQAELFGNSLVYPGKIVYLDGIALPGNNIGYWIVTSAKHILRSSGIGLTSSDRFLTQAILMRNTSATMPTLKGTTTVSPEFVTCTLSGGLWYSSSMQTLYDGSTTTSG